MKSTDLLPKEYPFLDRKIPVAQGVQDFQRFAEQYPQFSICPYLAYKDDEGWAKSTSRVYMNHVLPNFLYVPVNIPKDDNPALTEFFGSVRDSRRIVAVNITQPHKSNPVLMEEFATFEDRPANIDTLIRNKEGSLAPLDLNAPSFMGWYEDEVGNLSGKIVVIVGVGGVGEPIARRIAKASPASLILVDPTDKTKIVTELGEQTNAAYKRSIGAVEIPDSASVVTINAAGKEGATNNSGLYEWLAKYANANGVFVDLRPQLEVDAVEEAKKLGWKGYTGHGMNARNDYSLVQGIAEVMGVAPPPFAQFQELVAKAS